MGKELLLAVALAASAFEPSVVPTDADAITRIATQGGLTGVILVLMWYIKQSHQREIAEKDRRLTDKEERLQIMIDLAGDVKVALSRTVETNILLAQSQQDLAKSQQSMSLALAKIEERKAPRIEGT